MTVKKPQKQYYYHMTSFNGYLALGKEGLKASKDGYIYLLDTDDNAVCTMLFQKLTSISLFVDKGYGLVRVDPDGLTAPIEADQDGKKYDTAFTLPHQFRVKQKKIEVKYLKLINMRHIIIPALNIDSRNEFKFAEKLKKADQNKIADTPKT